MMAAIPKELQGPDDRPARCAICGTYVLLSDRDPDAEIGEWVCGCCEGQLVLFDPVRLSGNPRYGRSGMVEAIGRHLGGAA